MTRLTATKLPLNGWILRRVSQRPTKLFRERRQAQESVRWVLPMDVRQVLGKSDVRTTSEKVAGVGQIVPGERWKCPAFLSGASRGVRRHQGSSDRRGKCILTEKASEPDTISSSSSTFSIEKVVFKVISLLANMPLTFCLLTKDPSQSPQDPSCRHTRNRLTFGTHPPRARGALGAASCTLQRTGVVLPPKAPGSLCYREFHLCEELSHFETAGFVISPF